MDRKEILENFIESIGFEFHGISYVYKKYKIDLWNDYYNFHNGYEWFYGIDLNDLTLLEKYFKKELRSIKLKNILG